MPKSHFTPSEARAIRDAFDAIEYACETWSWRYPFAWRDAFRAEKRECSDAEWARGACAREFLNGATAPATAAELFAIREGARLAHLLGAAAAAEKRDLGEILDLCRIAAQALADAADRRFSAIDAGAPGQGG